MNIRATYLCLALTAPMVAKAIAEHVGRRNRAVSENEYAAKSA